MANITSGSGKAPKKTIDDYKKDYADAAARGDSAGMQTANNGANSIRKEQGQAEEKANQHINNVASGGGNKGTGGTSTPSGGGTTTQTPPSTNTANRPPSNGGNSDTSTSGYQPYQKGTNAAMEAALKQHQDAYKTARDNKNPEAMREANDRANQIRNQYGYAADYADADIEYIKNQIGYDGPAGGNTGTPSGSYGGQDHSQYLEEMHREQQAAALEALRAAYEKNVAGLDRTQKDISPYYQDARNQTAGQAELQKRNFAEYAAANGLNSGAGGQAQLSMSNALQQNLGKLNTAEASSMADLELQRSQMETDFNSAIAQAEAQGNYELAQQLYQEKVRQDEALRQEMMFKAQQDLQGEQFQFNKEQADISNSRWEREQGTASGQWDKSWAMEQARELAQYGNFSGYKALGYTDEQIQGMQQTWDQDRTLENLIAQSKVKTVSAGGSGGGGGSAYKPVLTYNQVMEQLQNGGLSPQGGKDYAHYNGEAYTKPISGPEELGTDARNLLEQLGQSYLHEENKIFKIQNALSGGEISKAEAEFLMSFIGR